MEILKKVENDVISVTAKEYNIIHNRWNWKLFAKILKYIFSKGMFFNRRS